MRRSEVVVVAALAAVLLGDVAAVAGHDEARPAAVSRAAAPSPSAPAPVATTAPKPKPLPPWRVLFSTTAPGNSSPQTRVYSALPSGQGKARRIGASTLPLTQVNQRARLVATTKVLSQTTSSYASGPYCNAYYGCPQSYSTSTEQGIVVRSLSGKGSRIVTKGGYDDTPVWSPDGAVIAYTQLTRSTTVIGIAGADGTDLGVVDRPAAGSADSGPAWSPDGQAVAVVRVNKGTYHVALLFLDGRPRRLLTASRTVVSGLAWAPDGRSITYVRQHVDQALGAVGYTGDDLWSVSVATGRTRQLTHLAPARLPRIGGCNGQVAAVPGVLRAPVHSPDGRFVAFGSNYPHRDRFGEGYDVQVLDLRSNRVVTTAHLAMPLCGYAPTSQVLGWVR